MDWLCDFYDWFWFNTQFWWSKTLRRPYTFVFHDFAHKYPLLYILVQCGFIFGMWWIIRSPWIVLPLVYAFIQGHVLWGGHSVDEQEFPTYIED
jgi:hypothetical protein